MKKISLKVCNIIFTGVLSKRGIDLGKVRAKSKRQWLLINEETSPILQLKISRDGEVNIHRNTKTMCISIWHSGTINIVGVRSRKEAEKCYRIARKEIVGCLTKRNEFLKSGKKT